MIRNIPLLILALLSFCCKIVAQNQNSSDFEISWITKNQKKVTPILEEFFQNEQKSDSGEPNFVLTQKVDGRPDVCLPALSELNFEIISSDLDFRVDNSSFKAVSSVKYSANQAYVITEIFPFRVNQFGQIEKLISANLSLDLSGTRPTPSLNRSAGNSVLAEGTWLKIRISEDGIYRLDRSFFDDNGIESSTINPNAVNVYGNTGDQLPFDNSVFRYDDLELNSIEFVGDGDSDFENGEYFLFYGDGPNSVSYEEGDGILNFRETRHNYSNYAHYFIRVDDVFSGRVQNYTEPDGSPQLIISEFDDYALHESEFVNVVKSGREWFGENFNLSTQLQLSFNLPNLVSVPSIMEVRIAGRSIGGTSEFTFATNGSESLVIPTQAINVDSPVANVVDLEEREINYTPSGNSIVLDAGFTKFSPDSEGWLDYVALQCRRQLLMSGNYLDFRTQEAADTGIVQYDLGNINSFSGFRIWDVSNPISPRNIGYTQNESIATFKHESSQVADFVAFSASSFQSPEFVKQVENQNLHALADVDLVILSNPNFLTASAELAEIHREEGLTVEVVTPEQVFNEYSSGSPDVTAIKMLMKMLYDDAAGDADLMPKHLCVMGDGTYINRGIDDSSPYVISYHSRNSVSPVSSYISDDYYALLDEDESELTTDKMDIGVGRMIVRTEEEALQMVDKIRVYLSQNSSQDGGAECIGDGTNSTYGTWRNKIVFVSDDQDGNVTDGDVHMRHSEELMDTIRQFNPEFNFKKIFTDAYVQTSTPGGERYDTAKDEIARAVENGALLVNYIGHGGEKGWAHERILDIPTIRSWTNKNRLPVFVTATCELTRYDDPDFLSAGELIYLNPDGGAIAMLTTTRIVFSGSNQNLAEAFYSGAFGTFTEDNQTLGDMYKHTKNEVSGSNSKNFSLIGDPALRMSHPTKEVYTTKINDQDITTFTDTLKALELVTFSGYVGDDFGNVLTDFNGFVYPSVFDKEKVVFTLANEDDVVPFQFDTQENILYNGKATVTEGYFDFSFIIPKDINFQVGDGRLSYYGVDGSEDGHGFSSDFKIGGTLEGAELNDEGPQISLFLNDESFIPGGITNEVPILLANFSDENGINTAGNGIGHDLKVTIDGNSAESIILNNFYEADEDSYQSGAVRYQLPELEPGVHTLVVKAWDTHNNSSEQNIEFTVIEESDLSIDQLYNYPNPFTTNTEFMFEHNAACNFLDVQVQVFTVGGDLVKTINERIQSSGYRVNGIMWDGNDDFGDELARGVYVYKIEIRTPEGRKTEEFQKLVLLK